MLNDLHELTPIEMPTFANGQDIHVKAVGQENLGHEICGHRKTIQDEGAYIP
jgi:hypothetical protein